MEAILQSLLEQMSESLPELELKLTALITDKSLSLPSLDRRPEGDVLPHVLSMAYRPIPIIAALSPRPILALWRHVVDRLIKSLNLGRLKLEPSSITGLSTTVGPFLVRGDSVELKLVDSASKQSFFITGTGLTSQLGVESYIFSSAAESLAWASGGLTSTSYDKPIIHRSLGVLNHDQMSSVYVITKTVLDAIKDKAANVKRDVIELNLKYFNDKVSKISSEKGVDQDHVVKTAESMGIIRTFHNERKVEVATSHLLAAAIGTYNAIKSGYQIVKSDVINGLLTHTTTYGPTNIVESTSLFSSLAWINSFVPNLSHNYAILLLSALFKSALIGAILSLFDYPLGIEPVAKMVLPADVGTKPSTAQPRFLGGPSPVVTIDRGCHGQFLPTAGVPGGPYFTVGIGDSTETIDRLTNKVVKLARTSVELLSSALNNIMFAAQFSESVMKNVRQITLLSLIVINSYLLGLLSNYSYNISSLYVKYIPHLPTPGHAHKNDQKAYTLSGVGEKELVDCFINLINEVHNVVFTAVKDNLKIYDKAVKLIRNTTGKLTWTIDMIKSYLHAAFKLVTIHIFLRVGYVVARAAGSVLSIMCATLKRDSEELSKWIHNRLSTMLATFSSYVASCSVDFYSSGWYSSIAVPNKMLALYAYCSVWPKCMFEEGNERPSRRRKERKRLEEKERQREEREKRREERRRESRERRKRRREEEEREREREKEERKKKGPELCDPLFPDKPDSRYFDCLQEGVYNYLSSLYKTKAEIIKKLTEYFDKNDLPYPPFRIDLLYDQLSKFYDMFDVSPSYYPLSSVVWWSNVVMGSWVWAIQLYGALSGISLANCMRNAWKLVRGDKKFYDNLGIYPPDVPHVDDIRKTYRYWRGYLKYLVKKAHDDFGHKVTGIRLSNIPSPDFIYKILRVFATCSRIKFDSSHYSKVAGLWLKPPRKELPKQKTLRAFHPGSKRGCYLVGKDVIADVVTTLLLSSYILLKLADDGSHPGTYGITSNDKLIESVKLALLGWVYGYYGFRALGQGKLEGKFSPTYSKLCRCLIDAVKLSDNYVEKLSSRGNISISPNSSWPNRVRDIFLTSWFIVHSYLAWRIYGAAKHLDGYKYIKSPDKYKNKLFATGLCSNMMGRGLTPECVDRHSSAVITMLVFAIHNFIYRLSAKFCGKSSFDVDVSNKEGSVKGVKIKINKIKVKSPFLPVYQLEGLLASPYSLYDDIVSLPEPDFAIKCAESLISGIEPWSKSLPKTGDIPSIGTYSVDQSSGSDFNVGDVDVSDDGKKVLMYKPNVSEILERFKGRVPFSLPAVWGKMHRIVTEIPFTCDDESSNSDRSSVGYPKPPESSKSCWNPVVSSSSHKKDNGVKAPDQPKVPITPPQPPQPPNIGNMLPKPPKPPEIRCPGEKPKPPKPPELPPPPQPPQLPTPPEWNPPDPPWKNLKPPKFTPPNFPHVISPRSVQQYLHDYFCSIIKYAGQAASYYSKLIEVVMTGGPDYLIKLIHGYIDYTNKMIDFLAKNAVPIILKEYQYTYQLEMYYYKNVKKWLIDWLKYVMKSFVDYFLPLVDYMIKCGFYIFMHAPKMILDYLKRLIEWGRKLLDPALWKSVMKEMYNYYKKVVKYYIDLCRWYYKFQTALLLGALFFIYDFYDRMANKAKQAMLFAMVVNPELVTNSWHTPFIEQYCGPDVYNSWRAGLYAIWNIPATLPKFIREGSVVLSHEARNRDLLYQFFYHLLTACSIVKKDFSNHYPEFKELTKRVLRPFVTESDPSHIKDSVIDALKDLYEYSQQLSGEGKEKVQQILSDAYGCFKSLYKTGLIHWDYDNERYRNTKLEKKVLESVKPLLVKGSNSENSNRELKGEVIGVAEVVHEEEIERFDVVKTFEKIGPYLIMMKAIEKTPLRLWLSPEWAILLASKSSEIEEVCTEIYTVWETVSRTWIRIYKLSEWIPWGTIRYIPDMFDARSLARHINWLYYHPKTIASEILGNFDRFVSDPFHYLFTLKRKMLWKLAEIAYSALGEYYEAIAKFYNSIKNLISSSLEVSMYLATIYWRFYLRACLLKGIKKFIETYGAPIVLIKIYNIICEEHNKQVKKYNEIVRQWERSLEDFDNACSDLVSLFDLNFKFNL